ncbi:MAG TPA: DUF4124 domain-containing protein [Gammaproteobacteria bacterium]|nr:DUF4124 domain-containing protein [Gammaproteobacteria bacterium]
MNYFIVLFLFMVTSVHAEIYKWTDKEGKIHFGDSPADVESATRLKINTESRSGITHSSGNDKERARMAKELEADRKERSDKREKYRAKKKKYKRKCLLAKDRLVQYQSASGVYTLDAKGERRFYSFEQRAKREKQIKKAIARYCH